MKNRIKVKDKLINNFDYNNKRIKKRYNPKKSLYISLILIVFFSVLLYLLIDLVLTPKIVLKKNNSVSVNYKEKYKEPGYKAYYLNEDITKKVKVTGKIDNEKLGTYKKTYYVKYGLFSDKVTRVVYVKDKSAPVIILKGDNESYVCPDKEYIEEGYTSVDNYDKDITKRVLTKKYKDKIVYVSIDKAGNKKELTRKLIYKDKEAPNIELTDGNNLYLFVGDNYKEPGYKAIDNCDGDLTKEVKTSGSVDTGVVGSYKVTYTVKDKALNEQKIERTINVLEHGKNGTIYLTFDDGPREGYTNVILDILQKHNVKATFFVTNNGPDYLIAREHNEGHTVGLHTASHNYSYLYSSVDAYFTDLGSVSSRVSRITGVASKIIRFPGGSSNTVSRKYSPGIMSSLTREVINRGYKYYDWNLSSGDAGGINTADGIYNNVVKQLKHDRVNIILMHDIKSYTRDALDRIITYGKSNGYSFERITDSTEMITQRVNN